MFNLLVAVVIGLLVGSFLACLKNRLDDIESILVGRSACPKCRHKLSFLDLFPVFSFVFLRGKCRYCRERISYEYPVIELLTAFITLLVFDHFGVSSISFLLYICLCLLLVASAADIADKEVHLYLLIVGAILAAIYRLSLDISLSGLAGVTLGMLTAAIIPFVLFFVSKERWMGLGDTFFALWVGAMCGYPNSLSAIAVAFISGAVFGIILLVFKKGNKKSVAVPFGPFLAFGGVVSLIYGSNIIEFYLRLLGF